MGINIEVKVNSSVKLVRPEVGTFKLEIRQTEKFRRLDEAEQKEWLQALKEEQRFHYGKDGEFSFRGEGLNQYFEIHKISEKFEYDGGECNIVATWYDSTAERSK
jgi:hypothetical protein